MNANAILDKILTDAKDAASAILNDANERAAGMRCATEEKIASAREKTTQQAETDAVSARARMERMAELEERKRLLADKRAMIDRAFSRALERMKAMDEKSARAFLLSAVTEVAAGDETVVPGQETGKWLDEGFVAECNASLARAGRRGELTLSHARRPGQWGLALVKNNTEINCTYDALLSAKRLELEAEVAAVLFPDK